MCVWYKPAPGPRLWQGQQCVYPMLLNPHTGQSRVSKRPGCSAPQPCYSSLSLSSQPLHVLPPSLLTLCSNHACYLCLLSFCHTLLKCPSAPCALCSAAYTLWYAQVADTCKAIVQRFWNRNQTKYIIEGSYPILGPSVFSSDICTFTFVAFGKCLNPEQLEFILYTTEKLKSRSLAESPAAAALEF